jgi:hypothetical protein
MKKGRERKEKRKEEERKGGKIEVKSQLNTKRAKMKGKKGA